MLIRLLVVIVALSTATNESDNFENLYIGIFLEECEMFKNESALIKELVSEIEIVKITIYPIPCGELNAIKKQVCSALRTGAIYLMAWASLPLRIVFHSIFNTLAPLNTKDDKDSDITHPMEVLNQVIYDIIVTWNWQYVYIYADRIYRAIIPKCLTIDEKTRCHLVLLFSPQKMNVSQFLALALSHMTPIQNKHFIIICNENTVTELLEKARDYQMFNLSYHWFFFNSRTPEMLKILKDLRFDSNVFFMQFQKDSINKLLRLFSLQMERRVTTFRTIKADRQQLICNDIHSKKELQRNVSRELNGIYNVKLKMVEVIPTQNEPELVKFAVWNQTTRRLKTYPRTPNFHKSHLKVVTLHSPPYVFINDSKYEGKFNGYVIDVLNIIAENLNFTYEIFQVADNSYGISKDGKNWTGIIGAVHRKEADLGVANLTPIKERSEVVQFLEVFIAIGGFQMLYKNPQLFDNDNYLATFTKPFSRSTWICTTITLLIMSFALCAMNEIIVVLRTKRDTGSQLIKRAEVMPSFFTQEFRIRNWVFIAIQVAAQQGFSECPTDIPTRIPFISLWIFSLLLFSSYSATLTSYFTFADTSLPFDTLPGLLKQNEYKFGVIKGTAYIPLLNTSSREEYQLFLKRLLADPSCMVNNVDDGYRRVKEEKYVFLHDQQTMRWLAGQTCGIPNVGPVYMKAGVTFVVPHGSQFAQGLNWQLGNLVESGLLRRLQKQWWPRPRQCTSSAQQFKALTVMNVMAPFLMLLGGLGCAAAILLIERLCKKYNSSQTKRLRRNFNTIHAVYIPSSAFTIRHNSSPNGSFGFSFNRRNTNNSLQDSGVARYFPSYSDRIYRYSADKQPHVVRLEDQYDPRLQTF